MGIRHLRPDPASCPQVATRQEWPSVRGPVHYACGTRPENSARANGTAEMAAARPRLTCGSMGSEPRSRVHPRCVRTPEPADCHVCPRTWSASRRGASRPRRAAARFDGIARHPERPRFDRARTGAAGDTALRLSHRPATGHATRTDARWHGAAAVPTQRPQPP